MKDVSILDQGKNWSVFGYSQIGSSHLRKGQERQDAFGYRVTVSGYTLLAVSDGHGSKESPDSRKGAELAVDTVLEYLDKYLRAETDNLIKDEFKELHRFSQREHDTLVAKWQERVMDDYRFRLERGETGLQAVGDSKFLTLKRYGCTLIAAIVTDRHAFFLQLGDGDVLLLPAVNLWLSVRSRAIPIR